jgi:hypothetical protein
MALHGNLPAGFRRPRAAVFAGTGFEPARVYAHLRWLIHTLGQALPVYVVRAMRPDGTPADIREDSEALVRGELARLANLPLFEGVRAVWQRYQIVVPKSACIGCLSYETEVITPNGARPIGSLVGRATLLNQREGESRRLASWSACGARRGFGLARGSVAIGLAVPGARLQRAAHERA